MREVTYNGRRIREHKSYNEKTLNKKLIRQIQIRNHILLLMTVTLILLLIFFFYYGFKTQASTVGRAEYKYFKSIEICSGDSLWSIAKEYTADCDNVTIKDYVKEVKAVNHLTSDNIKAGQCLLIPYYSSEFIE